MHHLLYLLLRLSTKVFPFRDVFLCLAYVFCLLIVTQNEQERSCIVLLRLQSLNRGWIWIHCVLQVKDASDSNQQPIIVCTNQVLRYAHSLAPVYNALGTRRYC